MKHIILLLIMSIFIGCSSQISFAPSIENYSPTVIVSPDRIKVYRTDKPDSPYKEIGVVYCPSGNDFEDFIKKMKIEASQKGGNAIIDLDITPNGAVGTIVIIGK